MNPLGLTYHKAQYTDLPHIVSLLYQDDLGQNRESITSPLDQAYIQAFHKINADPYQFLMLVKKTDKAVATCHLTLIHSLTFKGSTRLNVEALRVAQKYRNQGIGQWMFHQVLAYAKQHNASIAQLATNKMRVQTKNFYQKLGFQTSHIGMKLYL